MAPARVVRSNGGHRLDGDGPVVAAGNRFLDQLVVRAFSPATVRAYAFDLANFDRFLVDSSLELDDVEPTDLFAYLEWQTESRRGYSSRNHGSTTIVYEAVDLRPRGEIELPAVNLVVSSTVGAELAGTWTATSTAVDGVSTGQFTVPISPDPTSVTEMLDRSHESDD